MHCHFSTSYRFWAKISNRLVRRPSEKCPDQISSFYYFAFAIGVDMQAQRFLKISFNFIECQQRNLVKLCICCRGPAKMHNRNIAPNQSVNTQSLHHGVGSLQTQPQRDMLIACSCSNKLKIVLAMEKQNILMQITHWRLLVRQSLIDPAQQQRA